MAPTATPAILEPAEPTFWDHVQELRSRLIKILIGLAIASAAAYFYWQDIWDLLAQPITKQHLKVGFIATTPMETLITSLKMSLVSGAILSFPFTMWHVWRFLAPALFANERKLFLIAFFSSIVMFLVGAAFAYFAVLPAGLAFLATYSDGGITQSWRQGDFASFISQFMLAFGVIFELPVACFVMAVMGLITARGMWSFFRYAVILIFIVAALLTPGPDPVSQLMMATPLLLLYLVSIGICAVVQKREKPEPA
jgi:sec-independent protein translocase protein TatC